MKRILFYSQHVLGMGHFVRAMEIARGLRDFKIRFLNGGMNVEGFPYPPQVELVNLPPVRPDAALKYIESTDPSQDLEGLKRARWESLLAEFDRFDPDVLITELFPFGRRQFVFELMPLLARARQRRRSIKVVCSVRDILVRQPEHIHHEEWVCKVLNRYFDLVLVHADPSFQSLGETFTRIADIDTELRYTGYVVQREDAAPPIANGAHHANGNGAHAARANGNGAHHATLNGANGVNGAHHVGANGTNGAHGTNGANGAPAKSGQPTIVVSVGGGRVGYDLLSCAIDASRILERSQPHRMLVYAGPFLPENEYAELGRLAADRPQLTLERYTHHFLSRLGEADLSVSMAGYNTCMNVLTTGCRALVLPFANPGNEEQTIRANRLERLGLVQVIRPNELRPDQLADKMRASLAMEPPGHRIDTRGVERTEELITDLVGGRIERKALKRRRTEARIEALGPYGIALRKRLERCERERRPIDVFLRDDDVGQEERGLRRLLSTALTRAVPLCLEVIPGILTDSQVNLLTEFKHFSPTLLELNQHGWMHFNHELNGTKAEFGANRAFAQQLEDIARGKAILERTFAERFHAVFTPPWNRCTEVTLQALDQLGFRVLSRSRGHVEATGHRFREIPITIDLYSRKLGKQMRPRDEMLGDLLGQIDEGVTIGLLLHHPVMEEDAFGFVEGLLDVLTSSPAVRFHTFRSLMKCEPAVLAGRHA